MAKRPALGKGIGALLDSATPERNHKFFQCPIEELRPHSNQPRKSFDDDKLQELAASIREKGVIQPLVVRKVADHYQIIAGERRWRAAQKAGLHEVPVVIQDVSEDWALEIALIENIQREDLNAIEEAIAYQYLIKSFDLTQEEVAKRVGKERSTIANALRLLRLPEAIQSDVVAGKLSMGHARALLALEDDKQMMQLQSRIIKAGLSVRETEALVKNSKNEGVVKSDKKKIHIDPELQHLTGELQRALGTQVRISPKGRGGKIEITYFAAEDLDRLLERLGIC
ncbi:MAG: ParB/RepB/Spo0J family partition protein [Desulfuromonadales bacterium]|nr:ParB/RepB/Spo0J family partition protein [Desulfuromonadales bacterium]